LYEDGNTKIQISKNNNKFSVRFLSSFDFCQKLLKWIQENANLYLHYNKSSVQQVETQTPGYDLSCLELAGVDAVKLVRWLIQGNESFVPPLKYKISDFVEIDIENVRQIHKPPIEQRFESTTKRKWTDQEKAELQQYILDHPTATDEIIAKHLNRSIRAIGHQRQKLGLKKTKNSTGKFFKNSNTKYTSEEISLILEALNSCESRTQDVLINLVNKLNSLPNQTTTRTIRGVRQYIKKYIDGEQKT
jgi:hypothetical protein